jgi:preprotein translocase SecE subunit
VARNRQRAKERQARRRAQGGDGEAAPRDDAPDATAPREAAAPDVVTPPDTAALPPERIPGDERLEEAELRAGAPPHHLGRSDEVLDDQPDVEDDDEHFDPVEDEPEDDTEAEAAEPAGRGGRDASQDADRPRLVQFLLAVRAELGRVQWPNRQATTTLTGVVLGFVLLAGAYLGLLDLIFSRVIQAIL